MYDLIASNKRRSVFLLLGFSLFLVVVGMAAGLVLGNPVVGTTFAFVVSGVMAVVSYWKSDTIALKVSRAVPADEVEYKRLHNLVEGLCIAGGLPKPRLYVINDQAPNAFATGRNPEHALIAFTTGILDAMDRDQLQGVIAHEMAHVANRDTLVSAVAATTAGAIAIVSDMLTRMMFFGGGRDRNREGGGNPIALVISLVILILAPLAAMMLRSAISRKRESLADATAVSFTRNPTGLRSALEVLAADSTVVRQRSTAVAHIWIESPLDAKSVSKLFSTHPPIAERIAVLKSMESLA